MNLNSHSQLDRCAVAFRRICGLVVFLALLFSFNFEVQAQFPGFGFQNQGTASRSRTSTRQYPNNQVGDAVISVDPETRHLIVIADEDTTKYISQVVSNLDR